MSETSPTPKRRGKAGPIVLGVIIAFAAYGVLTLLANIGERKNEGRTTFFQVTEITEDIDDPAEWGKNFPLQYDDYQKTVDIAHTKYGGSEALPRTPTADDPRTEVAPSKIEADPRMVRMWDGYAFAIDYREKRGHAYMLEDQTFTRRQEVSQFGSCMACHASTVSAYRKLGDGDLTEGFHAMNKMPYEEARGHVDSPIACIDCHDPETMDLRISRPAFVEGIKNYKAHQGIENFDVNTMATREEMRSFVCAQCHVEYYFKGEGRTVTFPWHKGLQADNILSYFEDVAFSDWTHAKTEARMLKPQHPEFELWNQGVHARAGVSCVDCHMPYKRVGAMKITDHHVRSPLLNVNRACQTCHKVPEQELVARVEQIQERTIEMVDMTMEALMGLLDKMEAHQQNGGSAEALEIAKEAQRNATWFVDFIEAENSSGFHAPQESARILFKAMDEIRKGEIALSSE